MKIKKFLTGVRVREVEGSNKQLGLRSEFRDLYVIFTMLLQLYFSVWSTL